MKAAYYEHRLKADNGPVDLVSAVAKFIVDAGGDKDTDTDLRKTYRAYRWVCGHIAQDVTLLEVQQRGESHPLLQAQEPQDVIARGTATPEGYVDLFLALLAAVAPEVEAVKVKGAARGEASVANASGMVEASGVEQGWAWAAVKVPEVGSWRIVDAAGAAAAYALTDSAGIATGSAGTGNADVTPSNTPRGCRVVRGFADDARYFMMDPAVAQYYLAPQDAAQWYLAGGAPARLPVLRPRYFAHGLGWAKDEGEDSTPPGVVEVENGQLELEALYANNVDVMVHFELYPVGSGGSGSGASGASAPARDDGLRRIAAAVAPNIGQTPLSSQYWFKALQYQDKSTRPGAGGSATASYTADVTPGAQAGAGAGAGAGAAPSGDGDAAAATSSLPGTPHANAADGGDEGAFVPVQENNRPTSNPPREQRWFHQLHVKFPEAGTFQLRVLTSVPKLGQTAPGLAAVFTINVHRAAQATLMQLGASEVTANRSFRMEKKLIFPRPLRNANLIWLVDPTEGE